MQIKIQWLYALFETPCIMVGNNFITGRTCLDCTMRKRRAFYNAQFIYELTNGRFKRYNVLDLLHERRSDTL